MHTALNLARRLCGLAYLFLAGSLMVSGWVTYCGLESVAPTFDPPALDGMAFLTGAFGLVLLLIGMVFRLTGARWALVIALLAVLLLVGSTLPELGRHAIDVGTAPLRQEAYWILLGCTTMLVLTVLTRYKWRSR
jgi:hypothetical protein